MVTILEVNGSNSGHWVLPTQGGHIFGTELQEVVKKAKVKVTWCGGRVRVMHAGHGRITAKLQMVERSALVERVVEIVTEWFEGDDEEVLVVFDPLGVM